MFGRIVVMLATGVVSFGARRVERLRTLARSDDLLHDGRNDLLRKGNAQCLDAIVSVVCIGEVQC